MFSASKTSGPSGYNLTNSLRFRSSASAYLNRTPASAGNRKTWTWSGWVKRGALTASTDFTLFSAGTTSPTYDSLRISSDTLQFFQTGGTTANIVTTQVLRDPSAWYHIVLAVDTTQATSTNRFKLYINGSQVTAFGTAVYPSQNADGAINNTYVHAVGALWITSAQQYLDGYLTEVNFIDGQALTPSSFGSTNSTTGVWQPAKYTGTYGTNGFYLPFTNTNTSTYSGYSTDAGANYNTLPTGSQGTNFTFSGDITIEGWVYYPTNVGDQSFYVSNSGSLYFALNIDTTTSGSTSSNSYTVYCNSSTPTAIITHGIVVGAWNHVAMVRSGSTITLYTNGVSKGTFTNSSTFGFSSLTLNRFGGGASGARYLSNVRITKSAVYTANFIPPSSALTNIANTVVLTYQNSSAIDNSSNAYAIGTTGTMTYPVAYPFAANIASDKSGNANNWTPNNIQVVTPSATTYDSMTDVPTLATIYSLNAPCNYAVMNPLTNLAGLTVSNANLNVSVGNGSSWKSVVGTMALPSTGKWYWEVTVVTGTGSTQEIIGVANTVDNISASYSGSTTNTYGYQSNGSKNNNASGVAYGASYTTNDVIGVAVDLDAGTIVFYKNNTSQGTAFTGLSSSYSYIPAISLLGTTSNFAANFGQRPFTYTPPTGYVALNTYNLPTSTIVQGNKYMDATLYTGTNANLTITNTGGFKPDFVWVKSRSVSGNPVLVDSVRGANKTLYSPQTTAEETPNAGTGILSFNSNGFSLGGDISGTSFGSTNGNTFTYVGWQWQAGQGSTSSNTSGSITSTVSVNASAGFSVVTYTGTGANATVGHGLGVAPRMIIVKQRSGAGQNWAVYHASLANTGGLALNLTNATITASGWWNNTSPTSSVFSLGGSTGSDWFTTNQSGSTYVAYCWAEIAGFSKFGSYTGNGSTDGPFIFLGFRPKYFLIKRTDSAGYSWNVVDSSTSPYNVTSNELQPNTSGAESTGNTTYDFLSNGVKLRNTSADKNASGGTYIYAAFAENPFKNALAR